MCSLCIYVHVHEVYIESTCMEIKLFVMNIHVCEYVGKLIEMMYVVL